MNKNLISSVAKLEYIEQQVFDTKDEAFEWILYYVRELKFVVSSYLYHREFLSPSFKEYVDTSRSILMNTLNTSKTLTIENQEEISSLRLKISQETAKLIKDIEYINSFIH